MLARIRVEGDTIRLPRSGGEVQIPLMALPRDKVDWINAQRRSTYDRLFGGANAAAEVRFASYHLPVVTTYSENSVFPFNCANKGVGFMPRKEHLEEMIEMLREVHRRTRGRPWKESLRDRVKAIRSFYFSDRVDYRALTTLEIFERNTFNNLKRNPIASLQYTGLGPEYMSFQVNAAVEIVPQGDPRHTFVMLARTLFESEEFHIHQPQFPYAYVFWISEVKDKTPFRVPVQEDKVQYERTEGGLEWTAEAVASIGRAPTMIQEQIRELIEDYARQRGYTAVDLELVSEAKEQFMPR